MMASDQTNANRDIIKSQHLNGIYGPWKIIAIRRKTKRDRQTEIAKWEHSG